MVVFFLFHRNKLYSRILLILSFKFRCCFKVFVVITVWWREYGHVGQVSYLEKKKKRKRKNHLPILACCFQVEIEYYIWGWVSPSWRSSVNIVSFPHFLCLTSGWEYKTEQMRERQIKSMRLVICMFIVYMFIFSEYVCTCALLTLIFYYMPFNRFLEVP